jgi:hypothetical protein
VISVSQVTAVWRETKRETMKRWIFAVAIAAVASVMVAATASADVARYQTQTATFTATTPYGQVGQWEHVWTRDYTVTINPCGSNDGTFTGTGVVRRDNGDFFANETITGTFNADKTVSFTAAYSNVPGENDFSYTLDNAPADGTTATNPSTTTPSINFNMETKVTTPKFTTSTYKNHGDYVSQMGGGADAAHSCIGMPIISGK